jgi:hypothetical protein
VAAVLRIAAATGLRVAPQLTGGKAASLGALDDVVLLRLAGLRGVTVDSTQHVARIGAGVLWLDLVGAAARHDLVAAHAWAGDLGVVGHCLDAGTGPYARRLGLAAGSVVGAEVVTADGHIHQVGGTDGEDMLWMLRGGCGVGVVTSLDVRLFPMAQVYAGSLRWPGVRAARVLQQWVEWCSSAADIATTRFRVAPDPEDASADCVTIEGLIAVDEAAAVRALAELRAAGPTYDTFSVRKTEEAAALFSSSFSSVPDLTIVSALPPTARDVLLDRWGTTRGEGFEICHLGAAARCPSRCEGARTCFDGEFGVAASDGSLRDALRPWTFPEPWTPEVEARLSAVRSRVDPADLIVSSSLGNSRPG